MRSPGEIAFRLRQEAANLLLLACQPAARTDAPTPLAGLPDPHASAASVAGSPFASSVLEMADRILDGRIPCLGFEVETGPAFNWRRDPVHGAVTGTDYFRRIPYLDFRQAGDHKLIWELSRHQHLVLLAQASLLTGDARYLATLRRHLESWWEQNPFQRGINWASALEAGFRALSWIWIYHLAGHRLDAAFRKRLLTGLYRHGLHLEYNLSFYFSPNTHLLGEAVALHAIGRLFPSLPRAERWRRLAADVVRQQMQLQVRDDGSHFEQSTYYHVYALDMFLFHSLLDSGVPPAYTARLQRMAEYLHALLGPTGELAFFGDDDGGRFFHPFGPRNRFGRATMATCAAVFSRPEWLHDPADIAEQAAWWLPSTAIPPGAPKTGRRSALFPNAGMAVMQHGDTHILVDCGPFGTGSAGHSHSDTLSLVVRRRTTPILLDPGTYTYVSDPQWRDRFRGSAAHNTIRIDGREQATPSGPFRWLDPPEVTLLHWNTAPEADAVDAECVYRGFRHRRRVTFLKPHTIVVVDDIEGSPGKHTIEQFWHTGGTAARVSENCFELNGAAHLMFEDAGIDVVEGWQSAIFGGMSPAPVLRLRRQAELPLRLICWIDLSGAATARDRISVSRNGAVEAAHA